MVHLNLPEVHGAKESVTVGRSRLETLRFAPRSPELLTLVLLHEGLGSVAYWKGFPRRLAAETGLGVFVYSLPMDLDRLEETNCGIHALRG